MYHMLLTISYSDLAYPITHLVVGTKSLRSFWNLNTFCLLYIYMNNNIFTYDKLKTVIFGFTIVFHMFSQVILKLSTMYLDIHH